MSYCVMRAFGTIKVKSDKCEEVERILDESDVFSEVDRSEKDGIDVSSDYRRYDEEDAVALYKQLVPYIVSAEIEFEGEDGTYWKHAFRDGKWIEQTGEIVYKGSFELLKR